MFVSPFARPSHYAATLIGPEIKEKGHAHKQRDMRVTITYHVVNQCWCWSKGPSNVLNDLAFLLLYRLMGITKQQTILRLPY